MSTASTNTLVAPNRQVLPNAVLGTFVFILTEVMLFAGFLSAFAIAKSSIAEWPPPAQPRLPIEITGINTLGLLLSAYLIYLAGRRFSQQASDAFRPLLGALLLGGLFIVVQGAEWAALLHEGLALTTSTHAAFFYIIVGAHALHATAGLLVLALMLRRLGRGKLDAGGFWAGRVFWYFVVFLWPVLYWQVYL